MTIKCFRAGIELYNGDYLREEKAYVIALNEKEAREMIHEEYADEEYNGKKLPYRIQWIELTDRIIGSNIFP